MMPLTSFNIKNSRLDFFFIHQLLSTFIRHHLHPSKAMDEISGLHPIFFGFFKNSFLSVELTVIMKPKKYNK